MRCTGSKTGAKGSYKPVLLLCFPLVQPSPRPLKLSPVAKVPCKLSLPRLSSLSTSTDFRLPAFAPRAASSSASRSRQPKVSASSASFVPASLPARLLLVYVRASMTPYRLELASKPALYFPR
jgi:hypothetical protein